MLNTCTLFTLAVETLHPKKLEIPAGRTEKPKLTNKAREILCTVLTNYCQATLQKRLEPRQSWVDHPLTGTAWLYLNLDRMSRPQQ